MSIINTVNNKYFVACRCYQALESQRVLYSLMFFSIWDFFQLKFGEFKKYASRGGGRGVIKKQTKANRVRVF